MNGQSSNVAMPFTELAPTKLSTLEIGRGLAALAVVLHHASQASDAFTSSDRSELFGWGIHGVDFFFVLSGFIIYHVHQHDQRQLRAAYGFLIKRLRRIYVPYLPITTALIVAYLVLPDLSQGDREWGWFTSITLLPSNAPPALSVAWTLVFEMIFYLFFLLFFATRYFWYIVLAWFCLIIINASISFSFISPESISAMLLDPIIFEFFVGMLAAHIFGRLNLVYWYAPLIIGGGG